MHRAISYTPVMQECMKLLYIGLPSADWKAGSVAFSHLDGLIISSFMLT